MTFLLLSFFLNRKVKGQAVAKLLTFTLQCYSVLSDIWVKIKLCILLESESSVLSTCNAFVCLSPPSKLKFVVRFCKGLISFSAIMF